ncbi:MAG: protein kinase [Bacteroidota bacterium]
MIGQTISHYKILEKLGEGGMGVVYKAEDTKLKRVVALKFLPEHLSASSVDKERFIQEAQAASALNHPNVCTIHDIQEHDGKMFIVMEFVDGQTLRQKKDSISQKQAIEIGIQIADGLAAAHEKGIVHRDIKPENIMIRKDGSAQIMDFGLAKLRASGSKITRLTKEGSTVGTAGYMSPEQVQGHEVDHRSDIFSFGVLLYELIAGQLPFRGVHETALMYEIVNVDPAPISTIKPEIDPNLDSIILDCLEKDPKERCQSVAEVARDLRRIKRESSRQRASRITSVRPISPKQTPIVTPSAAMQTKRQIVWPLLCGILGVALLASIWILVSRGKSSHPIIRLGITLPKGESVESQYFSAIAISPDGTQIVYRTNGRLYKRSMDSFTPEAIPGTENSENPFFSPNGKWIGFFSDGKLKKVSLSGGTPLDVTDQMGNRGAVWTKDGKIIFAPTARQGLFCINEDGSDRRQLTTVDSTKNERTHRWPQIMPDGKTILFTIGTMDSPDYYEDATIGAVNIETGERKVVMKGASTTYYLGTGDLLYSHAGILFAVPFDSKNIEVKGTAFAVLDNVSGDPTTGATNYSISDNGTLAYVPGSTNLLNRTLALIDRNGTTSILPAPSQNYMEPRISPDGKQVAVVIGSAKDYDIWLYDMQRHTMSRFTFGGINRSPVWSPDSKRIAYSYNETGNRKIIIRQADGGGTPEEIKMTYDRTYVLCWSRDGSSIIFNGIRASTGYDILVLPVRGNHQPWAFLDTRFDEREASLSPDGRWIAFTSNETGSQQIYVRPFPHGNGKWQISTDQGGDANWSPDGKTLFYQSQSELRAVSIIGTTSLVVGESKVLVRDFQRIFVESGINYDPTPDGKYFLCTKPAEGDDMLRQINIVLNWFDEIQLKAGANK